MAVTVGFAVMTTVDPLQETGNIENVISIQLLHSHCVEFSKNLANTAVNMARV